MKRYIRSASSRHGNRQPKTQYIYKVCDAMGWNYPTFKDPTSSGYKCKWGGRSLVQAEASKLASQKLFDDYGVKWNKIAMMPYDAMEAEGLDNDEIRKIWIDTYSSFVPQAKANLQADIDEIYKKTGIQCTLNRGGHLVVPYGPDEWED